MRRSSVLSLLACAAVLIALGPQPAQPAKGGPKPPPPTNVPLNITVNTLETNSPGAITNVQSDGKGDYSDGVDGVCAALDTNGNLTVDLACASSNPRVLYLYSSGASPLAPPTNGSYSCSVPNLVDGNHTNHFQAIAITSGSSPAFQDMMVGTPYSLQMVIAFALTNDPNKTAYRLNYRGTQAFQDGSNSSPVIVTRTAANSWNVEPVAPSQLAMRQTLPCWFNKPRPGIKLQLRSADSTLFRSASL